MVEVVDAVAVAVAVVGSAVAYVSAPQSMTQAWRLARVGVSQAKTRTPRPEWTLSAGAVCV